MKYFLLNEISSFSILISVLLAFIRYKAGYALYRPFFWFIWIGAFNDTLSVWLVLQHKLNTITSNIYVLVEFGIILTLFNHWKEGLFRKRFVLLLAIGMLVWFADNFLLHTLRTTNSIFRVYYSVVILFLSIGHVNQLVVQEKESLLRNPTFLICLAFIFFYSFKAFIETFYIIKPKLSGDFYANLFQILVIVNLLVNLAYAIAILCIPAKRNSTLRY